MAETKSKTKEKSLVIVESPAKSKTIKKILGNEFQIEESYGHIRNLPTKDSATDKLGFDVNNNFEPKFEIIPGKQQVVKKLNDCLLWLLEQPITEPHDDKMLMNVGIGLRVDCLTQPEFVV